MKRSRFANVWNKRYSLSFFPVTFLLMHPSFITYVYPSMIMRIFMPIKQEKMNRIILLAFKKLQCAILLEHFHQQSLENLAHLDKQKVIHRALFYLTL
ncbi:hypothetical protein SODG_001762 [Sodalis praecaptivus]